MKPKAKTTGLLAKAIAAQDRRGPVTWLDKLPKDKQDALTALRKEYWDEDAPCHMTALHKVCQDELKLTVSETAFVYWLKKGRPS